MTTPTETSPRLSNVRLLLVSVLGLFVGVFVVSILRMVFYLVTDTASEMSPMMFVLFAPVVVAILVVPTICIEAVLSRFWWRPSNSFQALVIGSSYASVLLALIDPIVTDYRFARDQPRCTQVRASS